MSVATPPDAVDETAQDTLRRRSLFVIAVALVLLAASTPVWLWYRSTTSSAAFADAETLEKNRLGAATLDIEVGADAASFEASNLAPGDVVSGQLELMNAGTLPLIFELRGASDGDPLADWIRFDVWRPTADCSAADTDERLADELVFDPTTGDMTSSAVASGKLAVGERQVMCLGARLLLEAPNDVQGRRSEIDLIIDAVHDIEAEVTEGAR